MTRRQAWLKARPVVRAPGPAISAREPRHIVVARRHANYCSSPGPDDLEKKNRTGFLGVALTDSIPGTPRAPGIES